MAKTTHRTHKVTYAHRKSYRKRHYLALVVLIGLLILAITNITTYLVTTDYNRQLAAGSVKAPVLPSTVNSDIVSTYGFSVSYNPKQFYASAIDNATGSLHVGDELATARSYETVRLSKQGYGEKEGASLLAKYFPTVKDKTDLTAIEDTYVDAAKGSAPASKTSSSQIRVNDISYRRTVWTRSIKNSSVTISSSFVSYSAVVNGSPLVLTATTGLVTKGNDADELAKMVRLGKISTASVSFDPAVLRAKQHSVNLLGKLSLVSTASADAPSYTGAERISATYGASVVKIYNIVAGDIAIDGVTVIPNYVGGGTGSGFIVSARGDIGTNGHVVVNDAREVTVSFALNSAQLGNTKPLLQLLTLAGAKDADFAGITDPTEYTKKVIEKIYELDTTRFKFVNDKNNLLVGLGEQQIDIKELVERTSQKLSYSERDTVKAAKLISSDFGSEILTQITGKFKSSDVALIRIDGFNYPNVSLGDVSSLSQGSGLNIMGFPGIGASDGNELLDKTQTIATLTTGNVSSIKKDTSGKTLIETDTEIGHGNSGGPAFDGDGNVIGIATYTVGSEAGDGVLNYVRDIKDFKDLADKSLVDYTTVSKTQQAWNKAIDKFYDAHYKAAIPLFEEAKALYPNHPKAAAMIAASQKRIAEGRNIDEFPTAAVLLGCIVLIVLAGGAVFAVILIHKKTHTVYQQNVAAGTVGPLTPGMQPLYVAPIQPATQVTSAAQSQVSPQVPIQPSPAAAPAQPAMSQPLAPPAGPNQPDQPK